MGSIVKQGKEDNVDLELARSQEVPVDCRLIK
jgi:hypothetical protein